MRVSREAAAESRKRITGEAARLMRENGVAATSVADVMTAAGMTTGGFYKHFESKEDLAAAAVAEAFGGILAGLKDGAARNGSEAARAAYFRTYLSQAHLANPGKGCPVAAMGPDGGRAGDALQPAFRKGVEDLLQALGGDAIDAAGRAALIRQMTMLVGAVIVARAVGPGKLRAEVIETVRGALP